MASVANEQVPGNDAERTASYFKNSIYQKLAANVAKEKIESAISNKLDLKYLLSNSKNTIRIADLGCAVGPNTFTSVQSLIDTIKNKCSVDNGSIPEFQVFFNDLPTNDFNALFSSLPREKEYYAGGVPASFHERIFPNNYVHVVQCVYALHWLSKLPEELENKNSPAWNKGKIHYASAPSVVLEAYARQWAKDFNDFLNARAQEIVPGGMLIVVMPSIPDGMPYSELANGILYSCFASVLLDMAKRGLISEEQVDGFNLPIYAASPGEFVSVVEKNGNFKIEEMGLTNPAPWLTEGVHVDMIEYVKHIRAAMEGMFLKHFSIEIVNEMFDQLVVKLPEVFDKMEKAYKDKIQAHYVLQRV